MSNYKYHNLRSQIILATFKLLAYILCMKYIESIQTIRPNHHVYSLSAENTIGVISEGVETTARKALKALTAAKKAHKAQA